MTHIYNKPDFEALANEYARNQCSHFDIIIAKRYLPYEIRRLHRILNYVTTDEIRNQVHYI